MRHKEELIASTNSLLSLRHFAPSCYQHISDLLLNEKKQNTFSPKLMFKLICFFTIYIPGQLHLFFQRFSLTNAFHVRTK